MNLFYVCVINVPGQDIVPETYICHRRPYLISNFSNFSAVQRRRCLIVFFIIVVICVCCSVDHAQILREMRHERSSVQWSIYFDGSRSKCVKLMKDNLKKFSDIFYKIIADSINLYCTKKYLEQQGIKLSFNFLGCNKAIKGVSVTKNALKYLTL